MDKLNGAILFIIVLTSRTKVLSFNIEDRDPMVKRANPDQKDSYFGFSVAQHAVSENSRSQGDY
ncbi:hypothetical protein BDFB_006196 [Asbolus verrucosus]|uniref:Uncharacterized protein n=1 Tax=Asbolus verrucosus TaxID=1661398 RepID=A0A482VPL4_ASBVE|nr:hypothetical protein BDFB_006196 [Asbolus verrucosus]